MSKTKIVYTKYDQEDGYSLVVKDSPYGRIYGHAFLNDEDKEIANQWDGCKIAEMRADFEIQKRRTKRLNVRADAINEALCYVLSNIPMDELDKDNPALYYLEELSFSAGKQAKDNQNKLAGMRESISTKIDTLLYERKQMREIAEKLHKNKK